MFYVAGRCISKPSYSTTPRSFRSQQLFQILRVLKLVKMDAAVAAMSDGGDVLGSAISENGGNLSSGQRQLLCLARALLQNNKIICLDEATANIDTDTDHMMQQVSPRLQRLDTSSHVTSQVLRQECKSATVIAVAHRLNTIMDYDRIIVRP
jgi:ABC-type multidrug transport system fused ATPase/permease subunit